MLKTHNQKAGAGQAFVYVQPTDNRMQDVKNEDDTEETTPDIVKQEDHTEETTADIVKNEDQSCIFYVTPFCALSFWASYVE